MMNSKQFLEQVIEIANEIRSLWAELDTLREISTASGAINYQNDRVISSVPQTAPFENTVVRLADLENEIRKEIAHQLQKHKRVRHVIGRVQDPSVRAVLRLRYLVNDPVEVCAVKLGISKSTVLRRLEAGYEAVAEITGYPAPPKLRMPAQPRHQISREIFMKLEEQNDE